MFFKNCEKAHHFARMQASATGLRHVGAMTKRWVYDERIDDYIQEGGFTVKLYVEKGRTTPVHCFGNGFARPKTVKRKDLGEFIKRTTI